MFDDEATAMAKLLALRQPQPLDPSAERVKGRPFCHMPLGDSSK